MPKINKISWGKITVDDQAYHQVLIIGDKVFERDQEKLESLFGTTHEIGDWERKKLLEGNPEIIIIGIGVNGVMEVDPETEKAITEAGIELKKLTTAKAVAEYNQLISQGKKVNILVHTTC